jgi:glycosyltransferase involved in cell wall biosynthesis
MRIGIIARADLTGLGIQSRNWVRLLNPDKTIVINSKPFNGNEQHIEWYSSRRNAYRIDGFIQQNEVNPILNDIDVLLTFEIPYNYQLITMARSRGVKTIIQNNWEFTDYLRQPELPLPNLLINHSYWHLDDQKSLWGDITEYCPTPLFVEDYVNILQENLARTGRRRFLHIAGRGTHEDRNGTRDLIDSLQYIPEEIDFELVIKTQTTDIPSTLDRRVIIDRSSPVDEKELYRNFDAMILPRRYAGACLPMSEALASGLPVIMTDIDPNNKVLPTHWLVESNKKTSFIARTVIDVYSADHVALAGRIAQFAVVEDKLLTGYKQQAREIAVREYSSEVVKHKWDLLMLKLGV